ncbi:hypothetical protein PIB30_090403, partial [Stylosanthes scabra]|nr:hypothetical protein [Stylosanthes scabra]
FLRHLRRPLSSALLDRTLTSRISCQGTRAKCLIRSLPWFPLPRRAMEGSTAKNRAREAWIVAIENEHQQQQEKRDGAEPPRVRPN